MGCVTVNHKGNIYQWVSDTGFVTVSHKNEQPRVITVLNTTATCDSAKQYIESFINQHGEK